ncbi:cytochrome P450 [Kutzneria viridogrisea]|uniref:Cytochrome P450 n=2 Tax=Kutzneria TaxID=43356 RepID=W5WH25_9PSEU|nr:cytochrome P450 [Kutzneria albida]AHH99896.1 hypothetical protein KALB_6537 [Kutzneria albida DSM 43870]MBA8925077.1 cytochrome P450 [Kutzneria viridogrisea]
MEPLTFPMTRSHPFDPPDAIQAMRTERPIARVRYPDGKLGWLVTRRETVRTVLADTRFSARQELRSNPFSPAKEPPPATPGSFIGMDAPEHTRYRRLLTGQFTVRRMRKLTEHIEQIAGQRLDHMAQAGPTVDLVREYAMAIPAQVICELLGVPQGHREQFERQAAELNKPGTSMESLLKALGEITGHLAELIEAKRAEPADDLLSGLITEGTDLTQEELTNIAFLLLGAGFDTTANVLSLGALALMLDPAQIPVLTDPQTADNAVEELLRYLPVVPGTIRSALEDVELEGELVRAGESVMVSLPAANRDPERFPEGDRLDLTRPATGHIAFGHGIHQCLGQQLARVELRAALPALFRRFPGLRLAVPPEQVKLREHTAIYGVDELPVSW